MATRPRPHDRGHVPSSQLAHVRMARDVVSNFRVLEGGLNDVLGDPVPNVLRCRSGWPAPAPSVPSSLPRWPQVSCAPHSQDRDSGRPFYEASWPFRFRVLRSGVSCLQYCVVGLRDVPEPVQVRSSHPSRRVKYPFLRSNNAPTTRKPSPIGGSGHCAPPVRSHSAGRGRAADPKGFTARHPGHIRLLRKNSAMRRSLVSHNACEVRRSTRHQL